MRTKLEISKGYDAIVVGAELGGATLARRLARHGLRVRMREPDFRATIHDVGESPTCDAYYCRVDAKMDADIAALRPALRSGHVELLKRMRCVRIVINQAGTAASGVEIESGTTKQIVHADVIAVCAGVGASAHLLHQSRTARHPAGLGNSTGCLGRYYGGHTAGMIFPLLSFTGRLHGMDTKTLCISTYYNGTPDWPYQQSSQATAQAGAMAGRSSLDPYGSN